MQNPFEVIDARLGNIENLLLDIQHPIKPVKPPTVQPSAKYGNARKTAKIFGVSTNTVRNWASRGKIKGYPMDGLVLFNFAEIEAYIQSQTAKA